MSEDEFQEPAPELPEEFAHPVAEVLPDAPLQPPAVESEPPIFSGYAEAAVVDPHAYRHRGWPSERTPNFADGCLLCVLMVMGLLVATGAVGLALYFHQFGLRSFDDVQTSTAVALGSQFLIYVVGIAGAVPIFRLLWGKSFFVGIHWNGKTVSRLWVRLILIAIGCNLIAMVGNAVLPFPKHAPIDKLFSTSKDAWTLMLFGVSVAPFFEEMIFRGFLVPTMATAWDWAVEKATGRAARPLDGNGNPVWSVPAMVFASLAVSVPFAFMHSAQVAEAWGPLLLLYLVSLILCAVRLWTKSLAASTLVHSTYNFILFAMMFWDTGGFRHMDKV